MPVILPATWSYVKITAVWSDQQLRWSPLLISLKMILVMAMIYIVSGEPDEFQGPYWRRTSFWGNCFELALEIWLMAEIRPITVNSVEVSDACMCPPMLIMQSILMPAILPVSWNSVDVSDVFCDQKSWRSTFFILMMETLMMAKICVAVRAPDKFQGPYWFLNSYWGNSVDVPDACI